MNDFRKQSGRQERQAIDGILNAPSRPQLDSRQLGRRPAVSRDSFRTHPRSVGDFNQSEGYHQTNQQQAAGKLGETSAAARAEHGKGRSILHMTLPNGKPAGRSKQGRHGKEKHRDWRKVRKWSLRGGLAVLGVLVLLGGFLFAKGYFKLNKVFKGGGSAAALQDEVKPELLRGEGDGRINVLLLGRGGDGHEGADLTDTILLASIDPVNKQAALVSIPRDLWVSVPGSGSMKINAVYASAKNVAMRNSKDKKKGDEAGAKKTQEIVSDILNVPIHYYGVVDFQAFQQAVDTVGGVTIDVPEDLRDATMAWQNGGSSLLAKKGVQTFDGRRALMYVRSRHGSARGDFDRAERQRLFIVALSQKILSAGTYTNPVKVSQLMDAFGDHVSTDFSINDAIRLMNIAKGIDSSKIESIGLTDPPNNYLRTSMINGQSVVVPVAGIGEYADIQKYIRSKLKDGYIVKENANITVLNGTVVSGLANTKAEELRTYGYNVGTVGDAPTSDYNKTVIVDLTGGKKPYTKNYLEKRFGVKVVTKLPDSTIQPGTASFVIILGQNETSNSQD